MTQHHLVYSTETGRVCPRCGQPTEQCRCKKSAARPKTGGFPADGMVRIRRETQGRNGKTVSIIYGLTLSGPELEHLARDLKQCCGTGGSVKEGVIVIQGDHLETLLQELSRRGFKTKRSGG